MMGFPRTPSNSKIWKHFVSLIGFGVDLGGLSLRHLDADLGSVLKAAEPFDWERINFILEVS